MVIEKPLSKFAMYTSRIICVVILLFIAYKSFAHHEPQHRTVYLNDYTVNQAQLGICLKKEHSKAIFDASKEDGSAGFAGASQALIQMGLCGIIQGHMKILEVYETYTDPDGVKVVLVRLQVRIGQQETKEVYSVLINITIKPKAARCDNCRPA